MRRILLVLLLTTAATAATVAMSGIAGAATSGECKQAVAQLQTQINALAPNGAPVAANSTPGQKLAEEARTLFGKAAAAQPQCLEQFQAAAASLLSTTSSRDTPEGAAFLGPIGWLWNEIYYTIFQGDTILMVMFGWELFLSPFILLYCALAVFRGTSGLLKKPYVPPELRTNET